MDEDGEVTVGVRADTIGFARQVAAMRGELEDVLGAGADRAGRMIEASLLRAVRTGKLGFEDLKAVALAAMAEIARSALSAGLQSVTGGGSAQGVSGLLGALLGLPGRATGGPVAPGRAYVVGERGPELFVPTAAGRVETPPAAATRDVRVAITVNAAAGTAPAALQQSTRQVARAVKAALEG